MGDIIRKYYKNMIIYIYIYLPEHLLEVGDRALMHALVYTYIVYYIILNHIL